MIGLVIILRCIHTVCITIRAHVHDKIFVQCVVKQIICDLICSTTSSNLFIRERPCACAKIYYVLGMDNYNWARCEGLK